MSGPLLTAADVADLLSVPTGWIYQEARAGRLPNVRCGRYVRFRREAIEAWVERIEHEPPPGTRPGGLPQ